MPKYHRARAYDFVRSVKATQDKLANLSTQRLSGVIGQGDNFQITETGFLLYNGAPGAGALLMSYAAAAGMDQYGNAFPAGLSVNAGIMTGVDFSGTEAIINPGPIILRGTKGITLAIFSAAGINNWTAPASVTSTQALVWGPSGKGGNGTNGGYGGGGSGAGEFAYEPAVAVTPSTVYNPTVGSPGNPSFFIGDVVTVQANSGQDGNNGSLLAPGQGGKGGTGSNNTQHFDGGAGGDAGSTKTASGGGGGGGGPSSTQPGNNGQDGSTSGNAQGGQSIAGGYGGAQGGQGGAHGGGAGSQGGNTYGGGSGGGGGNGPGQGAAGVNGGIILIYATGATSTYAGIVSAPFTDPVTGFVYQAGITSNDPTFGDSGRMFGATIAVGGSSVFNLTGASLDIATAGKGINVKEGSNCRQGIATLVAGSAVVSNTVVTANSRIFLTSNADGGTPGWVRVSSRVAGTSFTITSSSGTDTSTVAYQICEPG